MSSVIHNRRCIVTSFLSLSRSHKNAGKTKTYELIQLSIYLKGGLINTLILNSEVYGAYGW